MWNAAHSAKTATTPAAPASLQRAWCAQLFCALICIPLIPLPLLLATDPNTEHATRHSYRCAVQCCQHVHPGPLSTMPVLSPLPCSRAAWADVT